MPPDNDFISQATIVNILTTSGSIPGTLVGSTIDTQSVPEPMVNFTDNGVLINRSVWYYFTCETAGELAVWLECADAAFANFYVVKPPVGATVPVADYTWLGFTNNQGFSSPTNNVANAGGGFISANYPVYVQVASGFEQTFTLHWQFTSDDRSWIGTPPDASLGVLPGMVFYVSQEWDSWAAGARDFLVGWTETSGPFFYTDISGGFFSFGMDGEGLDSLGYGVPGPGFNVKGDNLLTSMPPTAAIGGTYTYFGAPGSNPIAAGIRPDVASDGKTVLVYAPSIFALYESQRGPYTPSTGGSRGTATGVVDIRGMGAQGYPPLPFEVTNTNSLGWVPYIISNFVGGLWAYAAMIPVNSDVPGPTTEVVTFCAIEIAVGFGYKIPAIYTDVPVTSSTGLCWLVASPDAFTFYYQYTWQGAIGNNTGSSGAATYQIAQYHVLTDSTTFSTFVISDLFGSYKVWAITAIGTRFDHLLLVGICGTNPTTFQDNLLHYVVVEVDVNGGANTIVQTWDINNTAFNPNLDYEHFGSLNQRFGNDYDQNHIWIMDTYWDTPHTTTSRFFRYDLRTSVPTSWTPTFTLKDPYVPGNEMSAATGGRDVDIRAIFPATMVAADLVPAPAGGAPPTPPRGSASVTPVNQRANPRPLRQS